MIGINKEIVANWIAKMNSEFVINKRAIERAVDNGSFDTLNFANKEAAYSLSNRCAQVSEERKNVSEHLWYIIEAPTKGYAVSKIMEYAAEYRKVSVSVKPEVVVNDSTNDAEVAILKAYIAKVEAERDHAVLVAKDAQEKYMQQKSLAIFNKDKYQKLAKGVSLFLNKQVLIKEVKEVAVKA